MTFTDISIQSGTDVGFGKEESLTISTMMIAWKVINLVKFSKSKKICQFKNFSNQNLFHETIF